MTPTPSRVPRLSVIAGTHAGVVLDMPMSGYRVGCASQDDIVLSDAGVMPSHVAIRVYGSRVAVEAIGGGIRVNGTSVAKGQGFKTAGLVQLEVGAARLQVDPQASWPGWSPAAIGRAKKWAATGATALVACVVLFSFTIDADSARANTPNRLSNAWHYLTGTSQPVRKTNTPADAADKSSRAGLAALRRHLDDAGLTQLHVVRRSDSALAINGSLPAAQQQQWLGVHQWFDRSFGSQLMLINDIEPAAAPAKPNLAFSAIWLGANPYVVDNQGQRHYPGAALHDGWVLSAIEAGKITVTRGDERYTYDTRDHG